MASSRSLRLACQTLVRLLARLYSSSYIYIYFFLSLWVLFRGFVSGAVSEMVAAFFLSPSVCVCVCVSERVRE